MRKKLAAESRCDQEECSQRKGQFNSYHEDAVFQGKTQSRIVDTVQQADDERFRFLHVLGEQQGSNHGRDRKRCDEGAGECVAIGARHGPEDLALDALHGEKRDERRHRYHG